MKNKWILHPFLFAIHPIIYLVFLNIHQIIFDEYFYKNIFPLLFSHLLIVASILALMFLITRDWIKSAVLSSVIVFINFAYGPLISTLERWHVISFEFNTLCFVLSFYLLLSFYFVIWIIRIKNDLRQLTTILNITSAFIVLFNVIGILHVLFIRSTLDPPIVQEKVNRHLAQSSTPDTLPDIYYIILDRYANQHTLSEFYNYNNDDFINWLENQGFYNASKSTSNYLKTAHSLASSLNIEHIQYLSGLVGKIDNRWAVNTLRSKKHIEDRAPLYWRLQDYFVWRFLKGKGYKFIHMGTWWNPTKRNKFADININLKGLPQFSNTLYSTTILNQVKVSGNILGWWDIKEHYRWSQRERVLMKAEELKNLPSMPGPKFVFAHFLLPHVPYVFDEDGSYMPNFVNFRDDAQRRDRYLRQVIYTNRLMKDVIGQILSTSQTKPIIVLQSDEGPFPTRAYGGDFVKDNFNWHTSTPDEINEKVRILNAYYFPDSDYTKLYPAITPVNSFRVIFNKYFNTKFDLLDDRVFIHKNKDNIYDFKEVTDLIRFKP